MVAGGGGTTTQLVVSARAGEAATRTRNERGMSPTPLDGVRIVLLRRAGKGAPSHLGKETGTARVNSVRECRLFRRGQHSDGFGTSLLAAAHGDCQAAPAASGTVSAGQPIEWTSAVSRALLARSSIGIRDSAASR